MEAYILYLWLGGGALMLVLEMSGLSGVGFVFAGLAAFMVAALLLSGLVAQADYLAQFSWFFGFTLLWAALLWKPMQKFLFNSGHPGYKDMVGQTAIAGPEGLRHDRTGQATWSGTVMSARIHPGVGVQEIPGGATVEIVEVEGATLLVKPR